MFSNNAEKSSKKKRTIWNNREKLERYFSLSRKYITFSRQCRVCGVECRRYNCVCAMAANCADITHCDEGTIFSFQTTTSWKKKIDRVADSTSIYLVFDFISRRFFGRQSLLLQLYKLNSTLKLQCASFLLGKKKKLIVYCSNRLMAGIDSLFFLFFQLLHIFLLVRHPWKKSRKRIMHD